MSSHFDDVAFSCAGTIATLVDARRPVHLATIFSAGHSSPTGFALECQTSKGIGPEIDYMRLREQEDRSFARTLRLSQRFNLGFLEAPHRGYGSAEALFGPLLPRDSGLDLKIAWRIAQLARRLDAAAIWVPLGIGGHVDHRLAAAASRHACISQTMRIVEYLDVPYVLRAGLEASAQQGRVGPSSWRVCDVSRHQHLRARAVSMYGSQLGFQLREIGTPADLARRSGILMAQIGGCSAKAAELMREGGRPVRQRRLSGPAHGR
jgi:LmbE family N-acetylglucosaminyl deacetylase